jgi:hypothetical protein
MKRALVRIVRGLQARRCTSCRAMARDAVVVEGTDYHLMFCHGCADRIGVAASALEEPTTSGTEVAR